MPFGAVLGSLASKAVLGATSKAALGTVGKAVGSAALSGAAENLFTKRQVGDRMDALASYGLTPQESVGAVGGSSSGAGAVMGNQLNQSEQMRKQMQFQQSENAKNRQAGLLQSQIAAGPANRMADLNTDKDWLLLQKLLTSGPENMATNQYYANKAEEWGFNPYYEPGKMTDAQKQELMLGLAELRSQRLTDIKGGAGFTKKIGDWFSEKLGNNQTDTGPNRSGGSETLGLRPKARTPSTGSFGMQ